MRPGPNADSDFASTKVLVILQLKPVKKHDRNMHEMRILCFQRVFLTRSEEKILRVPKA